MREILSDTWQRVAGFQFTNWGSCQQPAVNAVNVTFGSGFPATIGLGYPGTSAAREVQLSENATSPQQFRYEVVHEMGHALGFAHDQTRPDNWSDGMPVYNDRTQPGETVRHGGNYYGGPDNASVMSYWMLTPTSLSATDVYGLRLAYGSSYTLTCQDLSDTYGIDAWTTWGFAPSAVQSLWNSMSCTTSPSSPDTCQKASDLYGINAGVTWGFAPQSVRNWWNNTGCITKPRSSIAECQRASETYGIIANLTWGSSPISWGTAPSEVQTWWSSNGCNTVPRKRDACQAMSDSYGIASGNAGWAPSSVQSWWSDLGCETSPTLNRCQLLSDLYGMSSSTWGASPQAARTFWTAQNCDTAPLSANTCQRASDAFAIVAFQSWGFAPQEVKDWWNLNACQSKPTLKDTCQTIANRFGIVGLITWGAAPADVQAWWTASSCIARPRDVKPIPG